MHISGWEQVQTFLKSIYRNEGGVEQRGKRLLTATGKSWIVGKGWMI
jgi:hypothetical protein